MASDEAGPLFRTFVTAWVPPPPPERPAGVVCLLDGRPGVLLATGSVMPTDRGLALFPPAPGE